MSQPINDTNYSAQTISREPQSQTPAYFKPMVLIAALVILVSLLILYFPTLFAPALYDEWYLSAWIKHLLKTGAGTETSAFLNFQGFDPRDGYLPLGTLSMLAAQLFGAHTISVLLHGANSLLVFLLAIRLQTGSQSRYISTLLTATLAGLLMAVSPLAPEAVAWSGGLPIELGTSLTLTLGLALGICQEKQVSEKWQYLLVLPALAIPFFSVRLAGLLLGAVLIAALYPGNKKSKTRWAVVGASLLAVVSAAWLSAGNNELPPKLAALKVPHVTSSSEDVQFEKSPLGNVEVLALPVNRAINRGYNKIFRSLYVLLPLPLILSMVALTNAYFRTRYLLTAAILAGCLIATGPTIVDRENFYGCRWLYPLLPLYSYLAALALSSPMYIFWQKKIGGSDKSWLDVTVRTTVSGVIALLFCLFLFPRAYTQNLSFKSNGKLWKAIQESIEISATKQASPFILVRDLPQSLSVAPMLSPFDPLLIDGKTKLPRSQFVSSGKLIDGLRNNELQNICLGFDQNLGGLFGSEFDAGKAVFGPQLNALEVANRLAPPLAFYNGAIKLDESQENLLLESNSKAGPACRITCDGLSPINNDFLYVDAKVDTATIGQSSMELHWVTNRKPDWEARERRVIVDATANDGQYHRYFFPLRSTNFALNGFPTHIMIGFPGGSKVALRSIGVVNEELPKLTVQAGRQKTDSYFAALCADYPNVEKLGLAAAPGKDNSLELQYDVTRLAGAQGIKIEIGAANSRFHSENAPHPEAESTVIEKSGPVGSVHLDLKDLPEAARTSKNGCVLPIRIFAQVNSKLIGHSSDSSFVLVDPSLN